MGITWTIQSAYAGVNRLNNAAKDVILHTLIVTVSTINPPAIRQRGVTGAANNDIGLQYINLAWTDLN